MSMAAALMLALATLSGCVRGPLAPPAQQTFLVDPAPRVLGPLQHASESDVHV
jgi:predicted small lipoprotein YifL